MSDVVAILQVPALKESLASMCNEDGAISTAGSCSYNDVIREELGRFHEQVASYVGVLHIIPSQKFEFLNLNFALEKELR